jgi:hypothetical protein
LWNTLRAVHCSLNKSDSLEHCFPTVYNSGGSIPPTFTRKVADIPMKSALHIKDHKIMKNQLNTGSLDTLKKGETLLVNARQVANGKIHLEFAEIIKVNEKGENVLALLNKSDDRFSSNARRTWITAEPADATDHLGVDFGAQAPWYVSERGEMLDLNILNPLIKGSRCRVVVEESTEPTEYQADNLDKSAKRKGKGGEFITHEGNYIFSNTTIALTNESTEKMHIFLTPDSVTTKLGQTSDMSHSIGTMI